MLGQNDACSDQFATRKVGPCSPTKDRMWRGERGTGGPLSHPFELGQGNATKHMHLAHADPKQIRSFAPQVLGRSSNSSEPSTRGPPYGRKPNVPCWFLLFQDRFGLCATTRVGRRVPHKAPSISILQKEGVPHIRKKSL